MKYIAAFDIGGTAIKYGIINSDGIILESSVMPTEAELGPEVWMEKIVSRVKEMEARYTLSGVAISSTAMIDSDSGKVFFSLPQLPRYTGFDIKGFLEERCNLPVTVENDVNSVALAESISGAGKGYSSVLSIAIGTGVGGGFTENAKLLRGNTFSACEVGYIKVSDGTLESLGSARALSRRVESYKNAPAGSWNGYMIEEGVKSGDADSIKALNITVNAIAEGLVTLSYILNPAVIVLGGGIIKMEGLVSMIRERYLTLINPLIGSRTKIVKAQYDNEAGMLGAYYNFKEKHPEMKL